MKSRQEEKECGRKSRREYGLEKLKLNMEKSNFGTREQVFSSAGGLGTNFTIIKVSHGGAEYQWG